MIGETIFLAHRLPFPPDRGDKIRSHHVLRALAALAPVHVGCLAEDANEEAHVSELANVAHSWCAPRRRKPLALAGVEALLRGEPVSLAAFRSRTLAKWVERTLRERPIAAIYVFSGQMGQYVPADFKGRMVMDLVDVDSAKFDAYGEEGSGLRARIDAREGRLLRQVEAQMVARADTSLLISEVEADLLRSRVQGQHDIRWLGNGIDTACYDPAAVVPHADLTPDRPHFVFTGQMDYLPNIAAVTRFATRILPAILASHPEAQFHIVGRAPVAEVRALGSQTGVHVWGAVPDVRPFVAAASVVVAPLTIARGVQNKVLEAMAMARPVIVSPEAATGIAARDGEHLLVAANDHAFAGHALHLLANTAQAEALGKAARDFVVEAMSWPAMLAALPAIIGTTRVPPTAERRDAA